MKIGHAKVLFFWSGAKISTRFTARLMSQEGARVRLRHLVANQPVAQSQSSWRTRISFGNFVCERIRPLECIATEVAALYRATPRRMRIVMAETSRQTGLNDFRIQTTRRMRAWFATRTPVERRTAWDRGLPKAGTSIPRTVGVLPGPGARLAIHFLRLAFLSPCGSAAICCWRRTAGRRKIRSQPGAEAIPLQMDRRRERAYSLR